MPNPTLARRIAVAAGREPADLVLKNAFVVNVFTEEILTADVAIADGIIAGVGAYSGRTERDCTGQTVCPGFIDAHMHIESTMASPAQFARAVLPHGTTTVIADPHEMVNVCGAAAVQYLLDATEHVPVDIRVMLPSSVPATPFETNGACFTADDMRPFLSHPRVLGLGEVMCYPAVLACEDAILDKIDTVTAGARLADGHAPGLSDLALQAYAAAGIATEHECTTFAEAQEKLRAGLAVLVREGSAAHNLTAILRGWLASGMPDDRLLLCTDDKHLDDIARDGHVRQNIKLAVELGVPPVKAIRMASWNAARVYGLKGLGAVAAGYRADLVIVDNLKQLHVCAVYQNGVEADNALRAMETAPQAEIPAALLRSMRGAPVTAQQLALPVAEGAPTHVIELVPYQIVTKHTVEAVPVNNGLFAPSPAYTKLCVVERHGKSGSVAVCPLKGYGIEGGALATSVAHDSHNIIAAGDNDADLVLAINRCKEIGGGYVLARGGHILGEVPLAICGLMSTQPWEDVQRQTADILSHTVHMGIPFHVDPFITLSFMALPVIPALRLTDKGLFDVERFCPVQA